MVLGELLMAMLIALVSRVCTYTVTRPVVYVRTWYTFVYHLALNKVPYKTTTKKEVRILEP